MKNKPKQNNNYKTSMYQIVYWQLQYLDVKKAHSLPNPLPMSNYVLKNAITSECHHVAAETIEVKDINMVAWLLRRFKLSEMITIITAPQTSLCWLITIKNKIKKNCSSQSSLCVCYVPGPARATHLLSVMGSMQKPSSACRKSTMLLRESLLTYSRMVCRNCTLSSL